MSQPAKIYPSRALEEELTKRDCRVRCLWQLAGPKNTGVAWIECLAIWTPGGASSTAIVQTFKEGGWDVYISSGHIEVSATVDEVIARIKKGGRA